MGELNISMFALLVVIAVQLTAINASPYSQSEYIAMRGYHLRTQSNALKIMQEMKLKEMCFNVTGSNDAFRDLESAQERSETCLRLVINEAIIDSMYTEYSSFYYSVRREDKIVKIARAICPKKQQLLDCQKDYNNAVKSCADADGKKKMEKAKKSVDTLIDYICNNNAEIIESFTENGGLDCLTRNRFGVAECATNLSNDISSFVNPTTITTSAIDDAQGCKTATTFFNCFVDEMKKCTNQVPANILKNVFDQIAAIDCSEEKKENAAKEKAETTNLIEVF